MHFIGMVFIVQHTITMHACELSAHTCKLFLGQKWFQMGLIVPRRLGEKLKLQKNGIQRFCYEP